MNSNATEWAYREAQWERLIALLDEADAIQQALIGDEHQEMCYDFHNHINNMVDELEELYKQDKQDCLG